MKWAVYITAILGGLYFILTHYATREVETTKVALPIKVSGKTADSLTVSIYILEPTCIIYVDNPHEALRIHGDRVQRLSTSYVLLDSAGQEIVSINEFHVATVNSKFLNYIVE